MAYATVSNVAAKIPQQVGGFTTSSRPTAAEVEQILADVSRELDATLANLGYVVPVVGVESAAILREKVTYEALARALELRNVGVANADTETTKALHRYYDTFVKRLTNPADPFELPADATRTIAWDKLDEAVFSSQVDPDTVSPIVTRHQVF